MSTRWQTPHSADSGCAETSKQEGVKMSEQTGLGKSKVTASKPSGWRPVGLFLRNPIVVIPYLLSIALALLAPDDVLDRWSLLKAWVTYVEQYVPIVSNYAKRSAFPQVTALYFSIVVLMMTPSFLWGVLATPGFVVNEDKFSRLQERFGVFHSLISWVIALGLMPLLAYFCLMVNPGYDFNIMPINRSKIALALFGPLFAGGVAGGCIAASLNLSRRLLSKI